MAQFTNTATLSYGGRKLKSNTVTGELVDVLTITKESLVPRYAIDDKITYVLTVKNNGSKDIQNAKIVDDLGAATSVYNPLDFIAGSLRVYKNGIKVDPQPSVAVTNPLTVGPLTLDANSTYLFVFETTTNDYTPRGTGAGITNTARIIGDGITEVNTATSTVTPEEKADLTISKSFTPPSLAEDDTLSYTFTIQNYGNKRVEKTEKIVISDRFTPILHGITVKLDNQPLVADTDYDYSETDGFFSTHENVISVPAAFFVTGSDGRVTVTPGVTTLTVSGQI